MAIDDYFLGLVELPTANDRYEELDEYDEFQTELYKLGPLSRGKADWNKIETLGEKLLTKGCKSLWVAGHFGEALFRNHGLSGLETAVFLLGKIIASQGEDGFPGYPKDKQLDDIKKIEERWNKLDPNNLKEELNAEDATRCLSVLEDFQADLLGSYGEKSIPSYFLLGLKKAFRPPVAEQELAPSNEPGAAQVLEPGTGKALGQLKNRDEALEMLKTVADYFFEQEPHSPLPYVLKRSVEWGRMKFPDIMVELLKEKETQQLQQVFRMAGVPKPSTPEATQEAAMPGNVDKVIQETLEPAEVGADVQKDTNSSDVVGTQVPAVDTTKGQFKNREEALAMLAMVADYFSEQDPHSPLPFVLQRSIKWGGMKFPDIMAELLNGQDAQFKQQIFRMTGVSEK